MKTPHDDEVVGRLRSFGRHPVDPDLANRHESELAAAAPGPALRRGRMRPVLAGALVAGAILGSTGLAAALPGSLPEQASSVAKSALQAVNLVGDDKDEAKAARAAAKAASRFTEGCTAGTPPVAFTGNHGQYVKAHPDLPETPDVNERAVAAQSDCGKPLSSVGKPDDEGDENEGGEEEAGTTPGSGNNGKGNGNGAGANPDGTGKPDDAGKPTDTGRPESPGNSEESHPPTTALTEQGSEHRDTSQGASGDAGKAGDSRPEGLGPPTSGS